MQSQNPTPKRHGDGDGTARPEWHLPNPALAPETTRQGPGKQKQQLLFAFFPWEGFQLSLNLPENYPCWGQAGVLLVTPRTTGSRATQPMCGMMLRASPPELRVGRGCRLPQPWERRQSWSCPGRFARYRRLDRCSRSQNRRPPALGTWDIFYEQGEEEITAFLVERAGRPAGRGRGFQFQTWGCFTERGPGGPAAL